MTSQPSDIRAVENRVALTADGNDFLRQLYFPALEMTELEHPNPGLFMSLSDAFKNYAFMEAEADRKDRAILLHRLADRFLSKVPAKDINEE